MKITITATDMLTTIDGVRCRVWSGMTEQGTRCTVFVHRLAVRHDEDATQFDRELEPAMMPWQLVPLRKVLP